MYAKLEQKVKLGGLSDLTLTNDGRSIAIISLLFRRPAIVWEEEQINGYLEFLLTGQAPAKSYFKHSVYGLRYLFKMYGQEDKATTHQNY